MQFPNHNNDFMKSLCVCVCVCVFYSVAVKYALSQLSYSHYINPLIGGCLLCISLYVLLNENVFI
jgi:hypothetical protein